MRPIILRAIAFTAIAFSATAASAVSTTLVQTFNQPLSTTEWTAAPVFNFFNPTLGTLTGVTVTHSATAITSGSADQNAAQAQTFRLGVAGNVLISAASGVPASLAGSDLNLAFNFTQSYAGILPGNSVVFGGFTDAKSSSFTALSSQFSEFTGPGTFGFNLETLFGNSVLGGGGNINTSFSTSALGQVDVVYTYDAVAAGVPEPSSWAMMIVGFGLAGVAMRKKAQPAIVAA